MKIKREKKKSATRFQCSMLLQQSVVFDLKEGKKNRELVFLFTLNICNMLRSKKKKERRNKCDLKRQVAVSSVVGLVVGIYIRIRTYKISRYVFRMSVTKTQTFENG